MMTAKPAEFKVDNELHSFAEDFSSKYKEISSGTYESENSSYIILYKDKLFGTDLREVNTSARVNNTTAVIEFSRSKFYGAGYSKEFCFFLIIWCVIMFKEKDEKIADELTIRYYQSTGRPMKNIITGYVELFRGAPSPLNEERFQKITELTKEGH